MDYESFLAGLTDELEKSAEEADDEPQPTTPEEKGKKKPGDKDEDDKKNKEKKDKDEEEKDASGLSILELAFFDGLYNELEKDAGWRDLGAGRIAKMKERMATGLKGIRAGAQKSLAATGKTGTPLYSVGEKRKPGSKFYAAHGGKGFKQRRRDPARRAGPKFQARVQQAIAGRQKPSGPSVGSRIGAWGDTIKKKFSGAARGAGSAITGAAGAVGRQASGAGGAVAGGLSGALRGAAAGRAKAMGSVRTTASKIPGRARVTPVVGQEESQAA